MLEAEERGVEFIVDPASCGCPEKWYIGHLDWKLCLIKKRAENRTITTCKCGEHLGIGPHLLGTTKEWMILTVYKCNNCRCAIEGCAKNQWSVDIVWPICRKMQRTKWTRKEERTGRSEQLRGAQKLEFVVNIVRPICRKRRRRTKWTRKGEWSMVMVHGRVKSEPRHRSWIISNAFTSNQRRAWILTGIPYLATAMRMTIPVCPAQSC